MSNIDNDGDAKDTKEPAQTGSPIIMLLSENTVTVG
jgi:hypothetical protein